ncbi:hypothetical protein [Streptomyces sp. NPDC050504]|uniref:hypothetical protein n=1 Tax=Streptomyces sp. NPDC050504 TaxID=3365618 RepID=UPI003796739F
MAGHGGARGAARRRGGAGLGGALLLLASACGAPGTAPDTVARDIQHTLDGRAAAVLARDADGYLAAVDPGATGLRAAQRTEFANLADVPLSSWEYRVAGVEREGGDRATVRAELRYRITGYDSVPVTAERELELGRRDGRWYVTADRPGEDGGRQLWQQGDVQVVHGARSLVLGVGQSRARLKGIAGDADRAVPAVSAAWPGAWARRVVVLVPASLDGMAGLLGAPAAGYRGIAAVTTGEAGGSGTAPADRVIVNPEAYGLLGDFGQRVVLTHETAHVATRTHTSAATPMWLSEGFADWAAYRGTGRSAAQAAPELRRAVLGGTGPVELPGDAEFGFEGDAEDPDRLARGYEGGWLACELIAEEWGEAKLTAFYRAVGAHPRREGAVEKAMNDVLATTPAEFTARWRDYLRERLG